MDHSCFDRLPDDGLVTIGSWVAATGLDNFARCLKVCRRFRHVLGRPSLLKELIRERTGAHEIETLEHLALWDAIDQVGLWEENRVGFGFGSLTVESDYIPPDLHQFQRRRERDIPYSEKRIADVTRILTRFPSTFLRIEAHCGTAAPPVMAEQFSAARGMSVVSSVLDMLTVSSGHLYEYSDMRETSTIEQRLYLTSWGMEISTAAERSQHRYASVARKGKGWVELYVLFGACEMPSRPEFYHGHERHPNEQQWQVDEGEDTQQDVGDRGLHEYVLF